MRRLVVFSNHAAFVLALLALAGAVPSTAEELPSPLCRLVLEEEETELLDAELEVELLRSSVKAYDEVFALVEGLWEAEAVERMLYLGARHDRDAARLSLESAELLLARQRALIDQVRLLCEAPARDESAEALEGALDAAFRRYLRADCSARAKAVEAARVSLEFQRQWLESTLELRAGEVATKTQVILARLDVERDAQRLRDARRRLEECRPSAPEGD
jgi:hypothetical protein